MGMFNPSDLDRIAVQIKEYLDHEEAEATAAGNLAQLVYVRMMRKLSEPFYRALAEEMSRGHKPSVLVDGVERVVASCVSSLVLSLTAQHDDPTYARQMMLAMLVPSLMTKIANVTTSADATGAGIIGQARPISDARGKQ